MRKLIIIVVILAVIVNVMNLYARTRDTGRRINRARIELID